MVTQITNNVISANTITGEKIQTNAVNTRHIADGSVTAAKLASGANVGVVSSNVNLVQSNLTALITNDYTLNNNKVFTGNVLINTAFYVGPVNNFTLRTDNNTRDTTISGNAVNILTPIFLSSNPQTSEGVVRVSWANSVFLANDYATLLTARSNDYSTYIQLTSDYQANDYVNYLAAFSNDFNGYISITANVNQIQSNVTNILNGSTPFNGSLIRFQNDVVIDGELTVEGANFTANVGTLQVEDANIHLNINGSNATAEGGGIEIIGSGNVIVGILEYVATATHGWRVGTGNGRPALGSADDIATIGDYQANDLVTYNQLTTDYKANDYTTFLAARSNDYNNYTQLTADYKANDYVTYLAALANDHNTFGQTKANDYITYLAALSNDYITHTQLQANINLVSGNAEAKGNLVAFVNTYSTVDSTNTFYTGTPITTSTANNIFISLDGINQSQSNWEFNAGNNTISFTESSLTSGLELHMIVWHSLT